MWRNKSMKRDPRYYTLASKVLNPRQSPFFKQTHLFDGPRGRTSLQLMRAFNRQIAHKPRFARATLLSSPIRVWPKQILIINASHDGLPLSWESARVARQLIQKYRKKIPVHVINTRSELLRRTRQIQKETLILSQCVDKKIYNVQMAKRLEKQFGTIIVPGIVTAPGSIFSDKARTYDLLLKKRGLVRPFVRVESKKGDVRELIQGIFRAMQKLEKEHGFKRFFVKPTEGGGGLGGFRISREEKRYFLPDLSKVSDSFTQVNPSYIRIPLNNTPRQDELLWIMDLFSKDPLLKKAYLKTTLSEIKKTYRKKSSRGALRAFLGHTQSLHTHLTHEMAYPKKIIQGQLEQAFGEFQKKFKRRYIATVNPYISFGTWGLRAHYRIGSSGPRLESLYARIFQLAFTPNGIGYVGSDNISNKQTGHLEAGRLVPLHPTMVRAIGGRKKLFRTLEKGLESVLAVRESLDSTSQKQVPIRAQMDLAPIAGLIGEGNADTARGMSIATHWPTFMLNTEEWIRDALRYYSNSF